MKIMQPQFMLWQLKKVFFHMKIFKVILIVYFSLQILLETLHWLGLHCWKGYLFIWNSRWSFPISRMFGWRGHNGHTDWKKFWIWNGRKIVQHHLVIVIYPLQEDYIIKSVDLLSGFGGTMGLWLGWSVMSLGEFIIQTFKTLKTIITFQ